MLAGLMSRWIRPRSWAAASPAATSRPMRRIRPRSGSWLFLQSRRPATRLSSNSIGQERDAAVLADLVDGDDVVVLDGGRGLGLAEEARWPLPAGAQGRLHHLQRHLPLELRILGQEHDAHAAGPEHLQDAIAAAPHSSGGSGGRQMRAISASKSFSSAERPAGWVASLGGAANFCWLTSPRLRSTRCWSSGAGRRNRLSRHLAGGPEVADEGVVDANGGGRFETLGAFQTCSSTSLACGSFSTPVTSWASVSIGGQGLVVMVGSKVTPAGANCDNARQSHGLWNELASPGRLIEPETCGQGET